MCDLELAGWTSYVQPRTPKKLFTVCTSEAFSPPSSRPNKEKRRGFVEQAERAFAVR